jgi:hypothetical protein
MNTIGIGASTSWARSHQSVLSKKAAEAAPQKTTTTPASKPVETLAESTTAETTTRYDLKSITPPETYELANELYREGTISFHDFAGMMAIGFSHQYPAPYSDQDEPRNEPYDLLNELEAIASGTHKTFTNTTKKDKDDVEALLEILKSLPPKANKTQTVSIDIRA